MSPGGARGDFVCGWLGTLLNVIDNQWSIDPLTGCTKGFFPTKSIDYGILLDAELQHNGLSLDPSSDLFLVAPCHGLKFNNDSIDQLLATNAVEVYEIDVSQVDHKKITWEFFVKTYLTNWNGMHMQRKWLIDREIALPQNQITDAMRAEKLQQMLSSSPGTVLKIWTTNPKIKKLDYNRLFQSGGSYYLCEVLGLDTDKRHHDFWDSMLPFANSPDSLTVWGREWTMADYFNA